MKILIAMLLCLSALHVGAVERVIAKEVVVNATLDQAWAAWITREGIVSFFAPDAEIDARVGGAFHIHIDPGGAPGLKGADEMRYMALQPKKMSRCTTRAGAMAASGTRPLPTSTAPGVACWAT